MIFPVLCYILPAGREGSKEGTVRIMGMSENDTSTLTNTGKMHVYFSQLAHCFHS
jgi:hypothetical protein